MNVITMLSGFVSGHFDLFSNATYPNPDYSKIQPTTNLIVEFVNVLTNLI
jgi:hypothetical protein